MRSNGKTLHQPYLYSDRKGMFTKFPLRRPPSQKLATWRPSESATGFFQGNLKQAASTGSTSDNLNLDEDIDVADTPAIKPATNQRDENSSDICIQCDGGFAMPMLCN